MNKVFLFAILNLMIINKPSAQTDLYSIEIQIIGLKNNNGIVLLQLFGNKNELVSNKRAKINNKQCTVIINNLKPGKYSVRYFHDENKNENLDTNWFGIPSEGYGFSNNASSTFGPPSKESTLFYINKNKKIVLTINY